MKKLVRNDGFEFLLVVFQSEVNQNDGNASAGNKTRTELKIFLPDEFGVNFLARLPFDFFDDLLNFGTQFDAEKIIGRLCKSKCADSQR